MMKNETTNFIIKATALTIGTHFLNLWSNQRLPGDLANYFGVYSIRNDI